MRLNIYSEPPTLDPALATDLTSVNLILALYEGLTRIGQDESPHPALAHTIDLSADHKTYTFHLRGANWSNGEQVTSYQFAESWRRTLAPLFPSPFAYKLFVLKNARAVKEGRLSADQLGVETPDSATLIVHLEHPTPYFLDLVAFPTFFPLPSSPSLFNGPFLLDRWDHHLCLTLTKNPAYWDAASVSLDRLEFSMIDEVTTECYMFEKGEVDWAGSPFSSLPSDILPALRQEVSVYTYPVLGTLYYAFNTTHPILGNLSMRKALAYAIHRAELIEHLLQGDQRVALALIPPMRNWSEHRYFVDGDEKGARVHFEEGLKELGLTRESFPKLTLSFNSLREHQRVAEAVAAEWKRLFDLDLELQSCEWRVYLAKQNARDFEICRSGWVADFNDPLAFLNRYRHADQAGHEGLNETGWENPAFTQLLDASDEEIDPDKRRKLLEEAEALFISEMPIMPLYFLAFNYIKKPYVHGIHLTSSGIMDFKWASVDDHR